MCAQQANSSRTSKSASKDDPVINFREVITKYLYHWPLYILVLVIALSIAYLYYKVTKPGYEIKATMVIQDAQDQKSPKDDQSALQEIDIDHPAKIVENEIEILKSRNLISKVIYDLKLWVDYTKDSKLVKHEDLYKDNPFDFVLIKPNGLLPNQTFEIYIKDENTFLIKGSQDKSKQFNFNEPLVNSFGIWKLVPTAHLKEYLGSKITMQLADPVAVTDAYQSGLSVALIDSKASTLELDFTDQIQERGKDFLNHLITRYNEAQLAEKNNLTQSTLDFIDKRLASLTGELSNAEAKVENYRSARGITDFDKQSDVYVQSAQANDKSLNDVDVQLNVIGEIESYVNSPHSTNVPSTVGISDPGLNSLIQKLSDLQIEREKMLATTPETNPIFDPVNRQIASTRSALKDNINNIKQSLKAQKRQLSTISNQFESTIKNVPTQEKDLIGLKRAQTLKENLYTYLLQKHEEVSLSYAATLSDARLVDSAYVLPPKSSKRLIPFAAAALLGLLIPTVLIYGRDSFKNRITNSKDILRAIDSPILGELSYEKSDDPIVVHDKGKFAIGEEFRILRTKLHYLHGKREKGRVTLVSSSISNEGKSFVSTNLSVTLAASGKKTVILEMDLRKPRVSAIFGLEGKHVGISNYLNGEVSEAEIIQKSVMYPNLDIIGSGDFYPNPSELLEQQRMEVLVNWLRLNYDYIIIDTPPVSIVTDSIIIARLVDVSLYVVRQAFTSKALLPFIKSIEEEQHFPKMNIVFNGVQKGRYGYQGYGGYGGYGYGDYIEDKATKKKYSRSIFKNILKRF